MDRFEERATPQVVWDKQVGIIIKLGQTLKWVPPEKEASRMLLSELSHTLNAGLSVITSFNQI